MNSQHGGNSNPQPQPSTQSDKERRIEYLMAIFGTRYNPLKAAQLKLLLEFIAEETNTARLDEVLLILNKLDTRMDIQTVFDKLLDRFNTLKANKGDNNG